jgi:hypothetical protein
MFRMKEMRTFSESRVAILPTTCNIAVDSNCVSMTCEYEGVYW